MEALAFPNRRAASPVATVRISRSIKLRAPFPGQRRGLSFAAEFARGLSNCNLPRPSGMDLGHSMRSVTVKIWRTFSAESKGTSENSSAIRTAVARDLRVGRATCPVGLSVCLPVMGRANDPKPVPASTRCARSRVRCGNLRLRRLIWGRVPPEH